MKIKLFVVWMQCLWFHTWVLDIFVVLCEGQRGARTPCLIKPFEHCLTATNSVVILNSTSKYVCRLKVFHYVKHLTMSKSRASVGCFSTLMTTGASCAL